MQSLLLAIALAILAHQDPTPAWQVQSVSTDADFRGVCAVSAKVAWISGTRGTFARTTDGGISWEVGTVPGAEKLDFRDIEAFDDRQAYLLSIGPGGNSRIYKTLDGGKTWKLQFQNDDPEAFYDALAFWDRDHGLALSDPVQGRFRILATDDGGASWKVLPTAGMPSALAGEGAFAASGTCLVVRDQARAWFVTGGAKAARVFRSTDQGRHWTVAELPMPAGNESTGAFSVRFRNPENGMVVGGDYRKPEAAGTHLAMTTDGGKTWKPAARAVPFHSSVAWTGQQWVAVGTRGSHHSKDGLAWESLDQENYNAVDFTPAGHGWAVGPKGKVAKFLK